MMLSKLLAICGSIMQVLFVVLICMFPIYMYVKKDTNVHAQMYTHLGVEKM